MLRVRLLGGLALEGLQPPSSRAARELLAWLALHPGAHTRLELATRFWPEVAEASARASLRTALHELRRALGEAAVHLRVDRERVELADVWVDVHEDDFGPGELLAGLDRDWVLAARDEHAERVSTRLAALADAAATPAEALRHARELVRHDPFSEDAARRLMRAHAAAGDRAAALGAYLRLEERLDRELSVRPSPETRRLLAELRAGAPPPLGTRSERRLGEDPRRPAIARRTTPLVGRAAELERIAAHRPPAALLLAGEPGIGKTRLLAEAARRAHDRGTTVLYGRCYEEHLTPYEPFVEALGELTPLVAEGAPESARWRLFEAVSARVAGALLLLDDIHWADSGTLRLLAHVLRRPDAPTVLAAYRDTEVSRAHPLADALADLRRDHLVERIALRGLPADAVAELAPAERAQQLHEETGGNPFFIEQVLADGGEGVPEGVKDVIGRRLNRLAPATGRVLSVAAVAGREFALAPIELVLPELDVLGALEEAAAAGMVAEERRGRYAFGHALVRETLYDELSLTRRVRTHRALADALATLPDVRLVELAHHRLEGGAPEAADTALAAAGEAMAALAYEEAAALCERALEHEPGDARLLLALGEAHLRTGVPSKEVFARAAAASDDPELLARAALGHSGLGVTIIAIDQPTVALLERALDRLPAGHPLRARLLARLAIETYYVSTPRQRKALVDEAVELARAQDDPGALLDALNARHAALWSAEYLDERERTADELIGLAAELGDLELELQGHNWRVTDYYERGDLAGVRAEIDAHAALAERLRLPSYTWWAPMWRASLAILEGRFTEAERLIGTLRASEDDPNAALYAEIQEFALKWAREDFSAMGGEALMEREAGRPAEYAYRSGYAWILAGQGQAERARSQIDWVAANGFARLGDDMNRLAALGELTEAIDRIGDPTHAAGVLERLEPYADRNVANGRAASGYGSAAHHIAVLTALLGRAEEADARFADALQANLAMGAAPWAARTRLRHAELLESRGQLARARELAGPALATARKLGIEPLVRRAVRIIGL